MSTGNNENSYRDGLGRFRKGVKRGPMPKKGPDDIYIKAMKVLNEALKSDDEKLSVRAADILMKMKAREKAPSDKTMLSPNVSAILGFLIEMIKNRPEISKVEDLIEKMMDKCLMCKRLGPIEKFEILEDTSKFANDNE